MTVIVRFRRVYPPWLKRALFALRWVLAFGSLRNPATRTIAIVEERDE